MPLRPGNALAGLAAVLGFAAPLALGKLSLCLFPLVATPMGAPPESTAGLIPAARVAHHDTGPMLDGAGMRTLTEPFDERKQARRVGVVERITDVSVFGQKSKELQAESDILFAVEKVQLKCIAGRQTMNGEEVDGRPACNSACLAHGAASAWADANIWEGRASLVSVSGNDMGWRRARRGRMAASAGHGMSRRG